MHKKALLLTSLLAGCGLFNKDDPDSSGIPGTWTFRSTSGEDSDLPTWGFAKESFDEDSEEWSGKAYLYDRDEDISACVVYRQGNYTADEDTITIDVGEGSETYDYEVGEWEDGGDMLNIIDDGDPNHYFEDINCF